VVDREKLSPGVMRLTPRANGRMLLPKDSPPTDPKAIVERLKGALPTALSQSELDELGRALALQPELSGNPSDARDALKRYWDAQGRRDTFARTLKVALTQSSGVEGVWAYSRLLSAGELFNRLETADGERPEGLSAGDITNGRLVATAALQRLFVAQGAMVPGTLTSVEVTGAHSYELSLSAVQLMAAAGPALVMAKPEALKGVEPDEIDVALKSQQELGITVGQTDQAAHDYFLKLGGVEGEAAPTAQQLEQLAVSTQKLKEALAALRDVTALRFAATR
jgi:hypothetical protein